MTIENKENMDNLIELLREVLVEVRPDQEYLAEEVELAEEIQWMEEQEPKTMDAYVELISTLVDFLWGWLPDDDSDANRIRELLMAAENYL